MIPIKDKAFEVYYGIIFDNYRFEGPSCVSLLLAQDVTRLLGLGT